MADPLTELSLLTDDLAKAYIELAGVEAANIDAYWDCWLRSTGESISAKNREAEANTYELETVAIQLKGQIKALERRYDYWKLCLTQSTPQ